MQGMKRLIIFILLVAAGQSGFGQAKEERKFKLKGKPILTIYANWHNGLGRANGDSGFELDRSYIGYEVDITEKLSGKVVLDIGPTNAEGAELERVAYVKNAMLSWKTGEFTLDFGLVSTTQFKEQEGVWGHRYLLKSFQDEYGFGSSADMGVIGRYRFADWLAADLSLINGEGYKKLNSDNKYRYRVGGGHQGAADPVGVRRIPARRLQPRGRVQQAIQHGFRRRLRPRGHLGLLDGETGRAFPRLRPLRQPLVGERLERRGHTGHDFRHRILPAQAVENRPQFPEPKSVFGEVELVHLLKHRVQNIET